jgi:hypothetical protein
MTKGPTRLIHEDPGFAHLVAASRNDGPSSAQVDKALSLATQAAAASRWTSWRWLAPGLAVSAVVVGTSMLAIIGGPGPSASDDAAGQGAVAAPAPSAPAAEMRGDTPVMTVSVADLAPAPPATPAAHVSARRSPVRPAASAIVARSNLREATGDGVNTSPDARSDGEPARAGAARTTFGEELALVSAARAALEAGDVPSCMDAVDRYGERFGSGIFAQEIEAIRIEALAASGDRARARAAAERFLEANARSPYADRVRSLIERTGH